MGSGTTKFQPLYLKWNLYFRFLIQFVYSTLSETGSKTVTIIVENVVKSFSQPPTVCRSFEKNKQNNTKRRLIFRKNKLWAVGKSAVQNWRDNLCVHQRPLQVAFVTALKVIQLVPVVSKRSLSGAYSAAGVKVSLPPHITPPPPPLLRVDKIFIRADRKGEFVC